MLQGFNMCLTILWTLDHYRIKGTVMQIEKAQIHHGLRVSKAS